jgi:hypothetical protein
MVPAMVPTAFVRLSFVADEVIRNESVQSRHTARTGHLFRDQLLYPSACFPDLLALFQQQAPLPPEECMQCSPTKATLLCYDTSTKNWSLDRG